MGFPIIFWISLESSFTSQAVILMDVANSHLVNIFPPKTRASVVSTIILLPKDYVKLELHFLIDISHFDFAFYCHLCNIVRINVKKKDNNWKKQTGIVLTIILL